MARQYRGKLTDPLGVEVQGFLHDAQPSGSSGGPENSRSIWARTREFNLVLLHGNASFFFDEQRFVRSEPSTAFLRAIGTFLAGASIFRRADKRRSKYATQRNTSSDEGVEEFVRWLSQGTDEEDRMNGHIDALDVDRTRRDSSQRAD